MAKKKTTVRSLADQPQTRHLEPYPVKDSPKKIDVKIIPGDTGQSAVTEIYLDGTPLLKNHAGKLDWFTIGTNQSLRAKFLEVYTVVTDIPGPPDKTSFDFRLRGGVNPYSFYTEKTVTAQGDSVVYKMTVFFTLQQ